MVLRDALSVLLPALARADAISVIGERQRIATEAMLRVLGRFDVPVAVVPNAMDFDLPPRAPRAGRRVVLVGGVNTWTDEDFLADALIGADVTVLGGDLPGHHSAGYARLRARLPGARFLPLVPHDALGDALATAEVTLCADRRLREAELGSRTRVLLALDQGLRVLATPRTELVAGLVAEGFVDAVETPADVHAALRSPRAAPDAAPLRARWSRERTTAPLASWVPRRVAPGAADALVAMATVRDAALEELAEVRRTPTWRLLNRVHRRGIR